MKLHRFALGFPIVISSFVLAGAGSRAAADPVVGGNLATEVDAPLVTLAAVASGGSGASSAQAGKQGTCGEGMLEVDTRLVTDLITACQLVANKLSALLPLNQP